MTTIDDPLVGTTYDDRYRVERRIGAGGMANVYLAEDTTLGRQVAIKVLHQRYAEDGQFVERFLREASAAARLNHPNIVQVYDRGQSERTYYIAMEYVNGMTLKELVHRRGGLTEQETLAYGRQALHALRFAHRNGIVHRDVKPHNMMVDTDGRLKIADFGIARAGADSGLTEAGSIVGTAQYLSPEQAQGQDVSATSDLYSLGVVMFEMSTGGVPFDGESPVNVALKHVKDPVPRPSARNADLSPELESIILKAMEKDPARRYQSADEMLADLDRARDGSATQAMTQVLGGAAIPVGAATTQVTPITPVRPPVSTRRYEEPVPVDPGWPDDRWDDPDDPRRSNRWLLPLIVALLLAAGAAWLLLRDQGDPVPDVSGATVAQARETLTEAGFVVGETEPQFSDEVRRGRVVGTDPEAGDEVEKGAEVDLLVSRGPAPEDVPDVVGKARNVAVNELRDAGFVPRTGEPEPSATVKAGRVLRQTPRAGADAQPGSRVTIVLSSGPEATNVPDVTGLSYEEAKRLLEGDDYGYVVSNEPVDSSRPEDEVIDQQPDAGAELEEGGRITLQVASGSNVVPDVVGAGRDEAIEELRAQGFDAEVVAEPTTDPAKEGVVLSTDPAAGQRREVGSTVTVRVGEQQAEDPAVIDDGGGEGAENGNGNGNGPPG